MFIQHRSVAYRPFEKIAIDVLDAGSETSAGNRYIFLAIDYFSKWTFAKATSHKNTETACAFVEDCIFHQVGVPEVMISDNGREFISTQFKTILNRYGARQSLSSPYYPQSNGLVERSNRTILGKLSKEIFVSAKEWDRILPKAIFAQRCCIIRDLGYSPYEILFGQTPNIGVRNLKNAGRLGNIGELHEKLIRKYSEDEVNAKRRGRSMTDLGIGSKVLMDTQRCNTKGKKKLVQRWIGPYC
ncbi:MAG: uncharacterized protein A8A55_1047 [Amphiamblys sp. WSBS2006]|nr:MAG: uncharacterized protein A8A55_1047 [Amphiamblys sp. WSBS2006]